MKKETFTDKLRISLSDNGKTQNWLASNLGMTLRSVQNKLKNNSFSRIEAYYICNKLNLFKTDATLLVKEMILNSVDIVIKNSGSYCIKTFESESQRGGDTTDLSVAIYRISFDKYKKIAGYFPMILIGDSVTVYANGLSGYDFMPPFETAENEELYLKCSDTDMINVIVNGSFSASLKASVSENKSTCKESVQKTYLMTDINGFVKIGKSINPCFRETTLMAVNPTVRLLAYTDMDIESDLHKEWNHLRERGEWFSLTPDDVLSIVGKYAFFNKSQEFPKLMKELRRLWNIKYNPINK